jgi:hypothetical protein
MLELLPGESRSPSSLNGATDGMILTPSKEALMAKYSDERGHRVSDADRQKTVELSGVQSRQGFLGRSVLMVLVCGLILALLALAGAEMFGESTDNDAATQVKENAPATNSHALSKPGTPDNTPTTAEPLQSAPTDKDPTPQTVSGG